MVSMDTGTQWEWELQLANKMHSIEGCHNVSCTETEKLLRRPTDFGKGLNPVFQYACCRKGPQSQNMSWLLLY